MNGKDKECGKIVIMTKIMMMIVIMAMLIRRWMKKKEEGKKKKKTVFVSTVLRQILNWKTTLTDPYA